MSRNEKLKMSNTNTLMIPNQKSYSSSPRTISNSATNLSNQPLYYNAVPRTKVLESILCILGSHLSINSLSMFMEESCFTQFF